jgi:hypothetical protein
MYQPAHARIACTQASWSGTCMCRHYAQAIGSSCMHACNLPFSSIMPISLRLNNLNSFNRFSLPHASLFTAFTPCFFSLMPISSPSHMYPSSPATPIYLHPRTILNPHVLCCIHISLLKCNMCTGAIYTCGPYVQAVDMHVQSSKLISKEVMIIQEC